MDTGETPEVRDILGSDAGDTGADNNAPPPLPQTLSPGGLNAPQEGKQLVFGKYKDMAAAEKAWKEGQATLTKEQMRRAALEKLLENPALKTLANSDPQLREGLTKAGYTLAEQQEKEEQEQARQQGDVWNGDENDPNFRIAALERKLELRDQRMELESSIGRKLKDNEISEIKEVMRTVSAKMPVAMAWKLTKSFEAEIKAKQDKELAKLRTNGAQAGQRLPVNLLPQGQKGDAQKARRAMSPAEKREALLDTVRKKIGRAHV